MSLRAKKGRRRDSAVSFGAAAVFGALRFSLGMLLRSIYRLEVAGRERVPAVGPGLLVANHVTLIDTFFIALVAGRPVRFVMHKKYFDLPLANWLFRALRCIPITSAKHDPQTLKQALDTVDVALANHELVCVFPEGSLTRDGTLGPFRPGVERIVGRRPVLVIPIAMTGLWRSIFSRNPRARGLGHALDRIRARVRIVVGEPIEPQHFQVATLRHQVVSLATVR